MRFLPLLLLLWLTPALADEGPDYCHWLADVNVAVAGAVLLGESRQEQLDIIDKVDRKGTVSKSRIEEATNIVNYYFDNAEDFRDWARKEVLLPEQLHELIYSACKNKRESSI